MHFQKIDYNKMKVSILQDSFRPGAFKDNFKKIRDFYKKACREDVDLAIVPTDALCGYEPGCLLNYTDCSDEITRLQKKLVKETTAGTALMFDTPFALDGSFLPSVWVAMDGYIQYSAKQFAEQEPDFEIQNHIFVFQGQKIYISYLSTLTLMQLEVEEDTVLDVDMAVLLDARPFMLDREEARLNGLRHVAERIGKLVYVAACGGHAGKVLTGASSFYSAGKCCMQLPYFESGSEVIDTEEEPTKRVRTYLEQPEREMELIHDAIVCAIRDYFRQNGIKNAVLGLSGGIDSAVVLPLAVAALGRRNVTGIMMPSQFSSDHSVNDAVREAENLQIYYEIIPIEPLYKTFMKQLSPVFGDTHFGLAEENLQARIRGNLLMAVANKTGAMLLNTSNKSEAACGYGTMYGDLCGGLSVIGDLYKSQVYALAHYINRKKSIIPQNCIDKAPSAELRPGQKDSDSLPPYEVIEQVLRLHLEGNQDEKEIVKSGIEREMVRKVLGLFYKNAYKRRQTPPVIRLSSNVLSEDIEMPMTVVL